jgi:hypothetical protein
MEARMLDFMLSETHAISILKKDHETVKELFDKFEKSDAMAEKERIIQKAVMELKIHATIEEEIFYPTVCRELGEDIMNEADEEHHVARLLIAELDAKGGGGIHRNTKFTVLAESVRHHIKEEENEMLPKAKGADIDFEAPGQKMLDRKRELKVKRRSQRQGTRDGRPRERQGRLAGRGLAESRAENYRS